MARWRTPHQKAARARQRAVNWAWAVRVAAKLKKFTHAIKREET